MTSRPWIGSTKKAATSFERSSASSLSRSPNGTRAQPGSSGPKPSLKKSSPTIDSGPSVTPWKLESHEIRRGRPVAARANFIAESTASAPVLAKNTASSLPGSRCVSASASIPASGE